MHLLEYFIEIIENRDIAFKKFQIALIYYLIYFMFLKLYFCSRFYEVCLLYAFFRFDEFLSKFSGSSRFVFSN